MSDQTTALPSARPDPKPGQKWSLAELAAHARRHPGEPNALFRTLIGTFEVPPGDRDTPALDHLSCHFWRLEPDARDTQRPHEQDELYFALAGTATLTVDGSPVPVATGDLVYIPLGADHRFHDVGPDGLDLLVVFAPNFAYSE